MNDALRLILVGVIGAVVVGWAINAEFVLGALRPNIAALMGTKMLVGMLAGASERLLPMLVSMFDERASSSAKTKKADSPTDDSANSG